MQLCRLVYYSTYNISSQANQVAADLKRILATAIRSNSENGLSGGLIFNRRFFARLNIAKDNILVGGQDEVHAVIQNDGAQA